MRLPSAASRLATNLRASAAYVGSPGPDRPRSRSRSYTRPTSRADSSGWSAAALPGRRPPRTAGRQSDRNCEHARPRAPRTRRRRSAAGAAFTALALASSASAGSAGVAHDVSRPSGASVSSTTKTAPSSAGTVGPAPGCTNRNLTLTDVLERGGHVLLVGTAASSLVGRKVKIIFAGRRQVATARIRANGLFSATAPLPPASMRESNGARYFAEVGTDRSLNLKLTRRLVLDPPAASAATVRLAGEVVPPLTYPAAEIVVEQLVSCSKLVPLTRVRPSANGRFHITLKAPGGQRPRPVQRHVRAQHRRSPAARAAGTTTPPTACPRPSNCPLRFPR